MQPKEAVALDHYTTGGLIQSSSRDRGDDECKCIVRASPVVHWKLTFTPLLDEAIHHSDVKVGARYTKLLLDTGVSRDWKTKNTAASWVFAFTAHTLTATDWLVALIDPHVVFT